MTDFKLMFMHYLYACWTIYGHNPADEVESLAAARKAALSGSEPSDSIRVKFSLTLLPTVTSFFLYIFLTHCRLYYLNI